MEELMAALTSASPAEAGAPKLAAPRNAARALKTHAAGELQRIQAVASLPVYRSDPFAALQSHLSHTFQSQAPAGQAPVAGPSAADAAAAKRSGVQNMSSAPYVSRRRAAGGAAPTRKGGRPGAARGGSGSAGNNGQSTRGRVMRSRGGAAAGRSKSRGRA